MCWQTPKGSAVNRERSDPKSSSISCLQSTKPEGADAGVAEQGGLGELKLLHLFADSAAPWGSHRVLFSSPSVCLPGAAQPPWRGKEDNNNLCLLQQRCCTQVTDLQNRVITGLAVLHKSKSPSPSS